MNQIHLDETFAREVKKVSNGDGSRKDYFAFLRKADDAAKELSCPQARYIFSDVLKKYGRATVGVCVAATILRRANLHRLENVMWAQEVANLWTNRPGPITESLLIDDGLHPSRIEEYAGGLIRATTA